MRIVKKIEIAVKENNHDILRVTYNQNDKERYVAAILRNGSTLRNIIKALTELDAEDFSEYERKLDASPEGTIILGHTHKKD